MIKTISYNNFSHLSWQEVNDFPGILAQLKEFHQSGGNLNHPILNSDNQIVSLESWLRKHYPSNPEYLKLLIDDKMIINPFSFHIDNDKKTISDIEGYGLYWMKENFETYRPYIIEAIKNLAEDIKDWDLGIINNKYKENFIIYNYNHRYLSDYSIKKQHPLLSITEQFFDVDVLKSIFDTSSHYKKLWSIDSQYVVEITSSRRHKLEHVDIAQLFYEYDIARSTFNSTENESESYYPMHQIISYALYKNNEDFIKKHIHDWNLSLIESSGEDYKLFIQQAKTKEIAELLIKHNTFIYDDTNPNKIKTCFSETMTSEALDAVLSSNKKLKNSIVTNPDLFSVFFNQTNGKNYQSFFNKIKLLVEKYEYPLHKLEFVSLINEFNMTHDDTIEIFKWGQENGADPRKCKNLISDCVRKRADGLKQLKYLQKNNLFNSFYPDPIYHILQSSPTKEFTTWLEKAPAENFSRLTLDGQLAWWGVNNDHGFNLIKNKVTHWNELSPEGLSYIHPLSTTPTKNHSNANAKLKIIILKMNQNAQHYFDISGQDALGNNVFHNLFQYDFSHEYVNNDLIDMIIQNTQSDIASLLLQKNKNGVSPLALMLNFKQQAHGNLHSAFNNIFSSILSNFKFDDVVNLFYQDKNKNQITNDDMPSSLSVYEVLSQLLQNHKELHKELLKHYESWNLYHRLDSDLNLDSSKSKKNKI